MDLIGNNRKPSIVNVALKKMIAIRSPRDVLGIDYRGLAFFRIGLGILLLCDLGIRFQDLVAHYTDKGVLPRAAATRHFMYESAFSIHMVSGEAWYQATLFALAAIFAICLIIGFKTRLMTFLSWFFLMSLHTRNTLIINGGDRYFLCLLFWAIFLPLGARFSIDGRRSGHSYLKENHFSFATFAILLQIATLYYYTALLKNHPDWWIGEVATQYALNLDSYTKPLGHWLSQFPDILRLLTRGVIWFEYVVILFIFTPILFIPARIFLILGVFALHLGISQTMTFGLFQYICMNTIWLLIPHEGWNWIQEKVFRKKNGLQEVREDPPSQKAGIIRLVRVSFEQYIPLVFLLVVVAWNIGRYDVPFFREANFLSDGVKTLRLNQRWGMFAPTPRSYSGWYIAPAKLENGQTVDLLRGGLPVSWEKPEHIHRLYKNKEWRKYMRNIKKRERSRMYLADYLCRDWNQNPEHPKAISVEIIFMKEATLLNQHEHETIDRKTLEQYGC